MYASNNGHAEVVKLLITNGADVNATGVGEKKMTSLIYASKNGHAEVAELLITNGADVNATEVGDKK